MPTPAQRQRYWRRSLHLTVALLVLWFVVTFGTILFARELNDISFLGFPFGFYMAAQGALVVYVLIVWCYARIMDKIEEKYGKESAQERLPVE